MTARRTATLVVAGLMLVFGLFAGVQMLSSGADTAAPAPTCTNRTVADGANLTSNLVTVNLFNASSRSGLANRVTINLQRRGFLGGSLGNSTSATKPRTVAILTDDRNDPLVKLVAAQFADKVTYAKPDLQVEQGVIVVVGDDYSGLKKKAPTSIKATRAVTACVPIIQLP